MGREYTAVPHEYLEEMDCLSDAEYGRLIRALQYFSMTGEEQTLSGGEKAHWKRVRNREKRYQESFDDQKKAKAERAKNAAKARWGNAQASSSMHKHAQASSSTLSNAKNAKTNTESESNTETKDITSPDGDVCTEQPKNEEPPVIGLLTNTGGVYGITQQQVEEWKALYPSVDVMQQLRAMKGWLDANPRKRKTKGGMKAFVNRWLAKEQDKPAVTPATAPGRPGGYEHGLDRLARMYREEYGDGP